MLIENNPITPISYQTIVNELLDSPNPVIVFKTRRDVLGESIDSPEIHCLQEKIKSSDFVKNMLVHRQQDGTIATNPYAKWQGPHWTLACLAEIGYPSGDKSLLPMRNQFIKYLFEVNHFKFPRTVIYPGQENKVRRCASQEANFIWYSLVLGLDDEYTDQLVNRLLDWQWPDGGWNCDKRVEAHNSSFVETIIPLRAISLYGKIKNDQRAITASKRAAEIFLKRHLYR